MAHATPSRPKTASPQIIVPNREIWRPEMFPKQIDLFEDSHRFILASGPRYCGKSIGVDHKILRHAWGTRDARVCILAKSVGNAKQGVWSDLTGQIWNEWHSSKLRSPYATFDWVKEPTIDGTTRMHYLRCRNYWGGVSEIQLHSLNYDGDVAAKMLNTRFSMIYLSEMQNFAERSVFSISILQLRMPGLPYEKHQFVSDTNPPDSGTDHFAWDLWYNKAPPDTCTTEEQLREFYSYKANFSLHEFTIDDNIFAQPGMVRDLKAEYANDVVGYNRMVLGRWEKAYSSKEYHFNTCFKKELHVAGDCSSPNENEWVILKPTDNCSTLLTGFDIGDVNHAFGIWEPVIMENDQVGFVKLDELVWIDVQEPLTDFIFECLDKIYRMEALCSRKIDWRHWSDTSSWRFSARSENNDAVLISSLSEGRVNLLAATKAKQHQSVRRRIKMYQDLLWQDRVLISASCTAEIDMLTNLRSGRMVNEVIAKGSPQKHCFDSTTYMMFSELFCQAWDGQGEPNKSSGSRLLSVSL